jgi:hypothetical protein
LVKVTLEELQTNTGRRTTSTAVKTVSTKAMHKKPPSNNPKKSNKKVMKIIKMTINREVL